MKRWVDFTGRAGGFERVEWEIGVGSTVGGK